jgi:hypothetical protein
VFKLVCWQRHTKNKHTYLQSSAYLCLTLQDLGGTRAVVRRSRSGTRPRPTQRPPPPPPPYPTTADNAAADADANVVAAALANVNESPATQTRRRLMLAIQSGSNAAPFRRGRDDNVLDNSPARRTCQRLEKLDTATVGQEEVQDSANRLTNVGRNCLLEECVKENVFPKINFAT